MIWYYVFCEICRVWIGCAHSQQHDEHVPLILDVNCRPALESYTITTTGFLDLGNPLTWPSRPQPPESFIIISEEVRSSLPSILPRGGMRAYPSLRRAVIAQPFSPSNPHRQCGSIPYRKSMISVDGAKIFVVLSETLILNWLGTGRMHV